MPVIARTPVKLLSKGLDLTHPPDLIPPGYQPRLMNAVVEQSGALDCRAGSLTLTSGLAGRGHTIRRLNNLNPSYSPVTDILLAGYGTSLYAGDPLNPATPIATGFSGNPLSTITFRPDQSTSGWMYFADQNKMVKVDVNQTVRNVGILSPSQPAEFEIGQDLFTPLLLTGTWVAGGNAFPEANSTRIAPSTTVNFVLYDSGTSGWACVSPVNPSGDYSWLQPEEVLVFNSAVVAKAFSVIPGIPVSTIASIIYDSGTSGLCSITLSATSPPIARNSIIVIGAENVRVLSVSGDSLGNVSFRCSTAGTYAPGTTVTGLMSIRIYLPATVNAGDTITDQGIPAWLNGSSTCWQTRTNGGANPNQPDLSQIAGRTVGPSDYMSFSVWVSDPSLLAQGQILLDVDRATNDFTHNYYYYTFTPSAFTGVSQSTQLVNSALQTSVTQQLYAQADPRNAPAVLGLGNGQWATITFPIAALIRVGSDASRTLANVAAIRLLVTTNVSSVQLQVKLSSWLVTGTYGPDVPLGSPTGIYYLYRYRATPTGARSNPSPIPRYQAYPTRDSLTITMTPSPDPQVDVIDLFRYDPNLQSANTPTATIVYVATIQNSSPTYSDQNDAALIASNEQIETNLFQPWPTLAAPLTGTCNISGNSVQRVSGSQFPLAMVPGTVITLGATNTQDQHQTFSFPVNPNFLQLQDNGGIGTGVPFAIYSPLLTGQPLPILFGPLEGPTATFTFGLGDPLNPGTVYWTNGNDPDTASDQNTLEITSPSEPLIGGCVWNTLVYVFSRDRVFLIRPSFDATGTFTFTFYALPSPCGLWSSWALCPAEDGVYFLGRDGIYKIAGEQVASITDATLYPLFPHAGKPGQSTNSYAPVDMTRISSLQLNFANGDVWFSYVDTSAGISNWRFDRAVEGWFPQSWPQAVTSVYGEPTPQTANPRLLATTSTGVLIQLTGTTDDGVPISATVRTPSLDNGDPRAQKLYVDLMTDAVNSSTMTATIGYDNWTTTLAPATIPIAFSRTQTRINISSISGTLALYRNIAVEYTFTSGTSIFEAEPAGYLQAYLSNSFLSRHDSGFPDWICLRDALIALISLSIVTFTIDIDGVATSYQLASTSGNLRKVYQLLRHASKGRMFIWQLQSDTPFALFVDETVIRQKSWTGDMIDTKPFQQAEAMASA